MDQTIHPAVQHLHDVIEAMRGQMASILSAHAAAQADYAGLQRVVTGLRVENAKLTARIAELEAEAKPAVAGAAE